MLFAISLETQFKQLIKFEAVGNGALLELPQKRGFYFEVEGLRLF